MENKSHIQELAAKVHDDMEGRYDLTGEDLHHIHAYLSDYVNTLREDADPRDLGLDDSWIHDVDMGAK